MRAWGLAIVLCLITAAPVVREAQAQPTQEDKANAKKAWDKAQAAVKKGEWAIAQREFGIAYELMKDPLLFYWIAYSHEQGGNCDAAVIYYRRYVKEGKPSDADKKRAEDAITKCEGAGGTKPVGDDDDGGGGGKPIGDDDDDGGGGKPIGDDDDGGGTGGTGGGAGGLGGGGPPPTVDTKPGWKWTAAWISVGGTIAFATAGAVLGLSAKSRQEDIENLIQFRDSEGRPAEYSEQIQGRYEDLVDEGKKLDRLSKISFAVAGGFAAGAILFFVLDRTSAKPGESGATSSRLKVMPTVSSEGAGLALGWEL